MEKIFYSGLDSLLRTFIICILAYVGMMLLLRISGKRTLSKINALDLIVTIALGSTLGTVILDKNVSMAEGIVAFAVLISLQFIITLLSVRSMIVSRLVKSEPRLLLYHGTILDHALIRESVTKEEILAAIRETGTSRVRDIQAAVLETDGTISIIPNSKEGKENHTWRRAKKTRQNTPGDFPTTKLKLK